MAQRLLARRKTHSVIGLDVGHRALRAAQLRRTAGRWSLTLLGSWSAPEGGSSFMDDLELTVRAGRWLRQLDFRRRTVVAGLSPPDVELHALELPPAAEGGDEQRRQAARWETQRLTSFAEGASETDYWPLPESKTMSSSAIGVAADKERLRKVLSLCRGAALDCAQIDASSCALARFGALYRGLTSADDDVWSLLDLGSRLSRLIVCVGLTPVLARVLDYGGVAWTQKLAASLSVSEETAERHKCDHGIARVSRDPRPGGSRAEASRVLGEMIYNVFREDLDVMLGEVERSYRYVLQCFPRRQPGPMILVGGGAAMPNLDSLLAEKLGIDVVVPSFDDAGPKGMINFDPVRHRVREPISSFACAIGLAATTD